MIPRVMPRFPSLHDDALRRKARTYLARCDATLAPVIRKLGDNWTGPPPWSRFQHLARIILYQQVSVKAAASVYRRLLDRLGGRLTARALAELSDEQYRADGVSRQKARYLRLLAEAELGGDLKLARLGSFDDEAVIEHLTQVKGLGAWSAEMFLIFALGRPDVLSTGDLGLQTAARDLYGLADRPPRDEFLALGEPWRPYRTLACWYLWRSLKPVPT